MTLAAFYPELVQRVILMCPTSFCPWPGPRGRLLAYAAFAPGVHVAQPTLILATRNDGAVSFDRAEYLAATLPDSTLTEVDTPTHLLWLGDGSDLTATAIQSFIRV